MIDNDDTVTASAYRAAGVDTKKSTALVEKIKPIAQRTRSEHVLAGIGGFGALFELPIHNYPQPVLVSGTDGVGTKLLLAHELDQHDTIGIDLVAMCVNDVLCQGAKPLFFLDYYATGQLNVTQAEAVIRGIAEGCKQSEMTLIGGETAEMPGMYDHEHYDLAGFCVGIVNKPDIIQSQAIKAGDSVIGIASSGPHSNGYSLIRKILSQQAMPLQETLDDGLTLGQALITPTRIYSRAIQRLIQLGNIHAIAHITGGGLVENIPRVIPDQLQVTLECQSWSWPDVFNWLQTHGALSFDDMVSTFNCGIGMVIVVDEQQTQPTLQCLHECGEQATVIGHVKPRGTSNSPIEWVK